MLFYRYLSVFLLLFLTSSFLFGQQEQLRYFEIGFRDKPDSVNVYAATSDAVVLSVAEQQLQLSEERRDLHIRGMIARGTNYNNHRYNWHFIPGQWTLVVGEDSIQTDDPRLVDNDLYRYLTEQEVYSPSDSYLKREVTAAQVKQFTGEQSIEVYPNPVNQKLFVRLSDFPFPVQHVVLYDPSGRPVEIIEPSPALPGTLQFEVGNLNGGFYTLSIRTKQGRWSEKVLVR